jgi:putative DNA-invertase from lambdoid prophage Rac
MCEMGPFRIACSLTAETTMRIATYHRASTLDQNPTLARGELRAAAAKLGNLVTEVEETGSGSRNDRPGLQRIMDAARHGRVDAVAVWKLDRFGRSALDLLANIQQLQNAGVRFIATTQGIDLKPEGDAMSRLLLTMLAAVSEFEKDLIRERTRLGMAKAKASGKRIGRPSTLSPGSAAKIKKLRAAGNSWSEVARKLGCSPWAARRAVVGQR